MYHLPTASTGNDALRKKRAMPNELSFSNRHKDLAARDQEYVLGWRFEPRIVFERGEGVRLFDIDGNAYYDMSAGMMSLKVYPTPSSTPTTGTFRSATMVIRTRCRSSRVPR